jgi:hypothetical protein
MMRIALNRYHRTHSDSEEQLRRADVSLRLMVESVTDCAIIMLDTTGHVENWNSRSTTDQWLQ